MAKRDFITVRSYTPAETRKLIDDAIDIKAHPGKYAEALKGKALGMIFEKPSLRTRVTFDVGIHQLGGFGIYLSPAEISLGKRESVADVAHNLERMVQGIMARTFSHKVVEELAACARIPIINGLTDYNHPCQAMADYMTLLEVRGEFSGAKLAYVGDGNNVAVSLIHTAARLGVHLAVATPAGYEPNPESVEWARAQGAQGFGPVTAIGDLGPTFTRAIAAVEAGAVAVVDVRVDPGYTAAMTAAMTRKSE